MQICQRFQAAEMHGPSSFTRENMYDRVLHIRNLANIKSWMLVMKIASYGLEQLDNLPLDPRISEDEANYYRMCLHSIKTYANRRDLGGIEQIVYGVTKKLHRGERFLKARLENVVTNTCGEPLDIGHLSNLPTDVIHEIIRHI